MRDVIIDQPDAEDLEVREVVATRELESANHLLGNREALNASLDQEGYLLLRGVLELETVARARDEMLEVAVKLGLTRPGDPTGRWTGAPLSGYLEESDLYAGIAWRLILHPANLSALERALGQPPCVLPIVQYRTYPPHHSLGTVHQDGFYGRGIQDFRTLWITLTPCTRDMGGLAVAVAQNKRGYFHNVAKPTPFPIPRGVIPDDAWATTDYMPGDLLIVHPSTPHCGLANTSDRLRITFDSRVQSAARPTTVTATVKGFTSNSLTIEADNLSETTLMIDEETFLTPLDPGVRETLETFADCMTIGMELVVVVDGNRAAMVRKVAYG